MTIRLKMVYAFLNKVNPKVCPSKCPFFDSVASYPFANFMNFMKGILPRNLQTDFRASMLYKRSNKQQFLIGTVQIQSVKAQLLTLGMLALFIAIFQSVKWLALIYLGSPLVLPNPNWNYIMNWVIHSQRLLNNKII